MKRIGALVCAMMMAVCILAPAGFAAGNEAGDAVNKTGFSIVSSSPEDGQEGVAVDNLSVKIYFSKEMTPENKTIRNSNAKQFALKDSEGNKVPVKVYYSDDEEGLILVAADTFSSGNKDQKIKGDEKYTLTIGKGLKATDGTVLGHKEQIRLKTLNQGRSTAIYMILMALMMAGMIFFTIRGSKKEEKKEKEDREFKEGVNPYKEAKKSGKSVSEVVAKESKKKAKKEDAIRRQKEAEAAIEAEIIEKIRKEKNKRVSAPKSISATGSSLKIKVSTDSGEQVKAKESAARTNKGTTNPKNRNGKSRNRKKK